MPHKSERKLIKVGETSLAVILPKAWLRYNQLNSKDRVKVVSNDSVTIEPLKEPQKE